MIKANPQSHEEWLANVPLRRFSFYLAGRVSCLSGMAGDVERELERAFRDPDGAADGTAFHRAEAASWFWVLGAYEVTRTMCQAESCFSTGVLERLRILKKRLAEVRMPAAKMEPAGSSVPFPSNRSPAAWDPANRDIRLWSYSQGEMVSLRELLRLFDETLSSIEVADVLRSHEDSYTG